MTFKTGDEVILVLSVPQESMYYSVLELVKNTREIGKVREGNSLVGYNVNFPSVAVYLYFPERYIGSAPTTISPFDIIKDLCG